MTEDVDARDKRGHDELADGSVLLKRHRALILGRASPAFRRFTDRHFSVRPRESGDPADSGTSTARAVPALR
jgi:hypothetical protein